METEEVTKATTLDRSDTETSPQFSSPATKYYWVSTISCTDRSETLEAEPLNGFGCPGVLEIVDDYETDTYEAVYIVKCVKGVCGWHVFKKKSKTERKTPQWDIDLLTRRLSEPT